MLTSADCGCLHQQAIKLFFNSDSYQQQQLIVTSVEPLFFLQMYGGKLNCLNMDRWLNKSVLGGMYL